jgi:glutathione S-transferase
VNPADMTLVGAYGSPYSIKMRAVLRYRRIPYRWVVRNSSQDRGFPDPPVPIIPVLVFHDDVGGYTESMVDSSPQIMRLETEYAQRSLLPTDPVVWFLDHLIEDYGDEWLTKVMYHYRWHHLYGDAIAKASNMLPLMSDNQMDVEKHRAMSEFIAERQMGRTPLVGSTDANRDVIEESFVRLLALLEDHFRQFQFLLGARPSRGDFGLFGQFSQLFFWEPDSALLAAQRSPRSVIWAYQIDDLSSLEIDDTQSWFTRDSLPESLSKLLHEIGGTYAPFLLANERALLEGEAELSCVIQGQEYKQSPFPYQLKCLNWIREAFETLQQEEQKAVVQILEGTGCELLLTESDV